MEAEAVVQHGKAAGGECQTLAVGAGNILAASRAIERLACFGGEFFAGRFQLATAQRVDQPAIEGDTLAVSLAEALSDQMIRASIQRLPYLGAEAGLRTGRQVRARCSADRAKSRRLP